MANIHRIEDYQNDNSRSFQPFDIATVSQEERRNLPFLDVHGKTPRQDSFLEMLKFSFCPNFELRSFTSIISIIDIVIYIITLIYGGIVIPSLFLAPTKSTLNIFGAQNAYAQKYQGEVWRFFTPVFLHGYFLHILMNIISQIIIGSMLEKVVGSKVLIICYFLSSLGGNLLSSIMLPQSLSVGASSAIFGMIGMNVAYVLVNWKSISIRTKMLRLFIMVAIVIMVISKTISSDSGTIKYFAPANINNWSHLGGFITGIFFGMGLIHPNIREPYSDNVRIIGLGFGITGLIVGILIFYIKINPHPLI